MGAFSLTELQQQADVLYEALHGRDAGALWRFKWEHPRFRSKTFTDVQAAAADLGVDDARTVIARSNGFDSWGHVERFARSLQQDEAMSRFERAADAVVAGDLVALRSLLDRHPDLVRARSTRRHHATLLHYVSANGVEGTRQATPANAVEIARALLSAGAEVDALADAYDEKYTTMRLLVSSAHPHAAGLQEKLVEVLADYGASLEGVGKWDSPLVTALAFGYPKAAATLVERGAPIRNIAEAAGVGRADLVTQLLPSATAEPRQAALALAAQLGHTDIVRTLIDAGVDPNRYNPTGFHAHSTPLHQATLAEHDGVVRLLVERGARLDIRDKIFSGTPLGWAVYAKRDAVADYLRSQGAP
jgi:ankyrin repeat protein